MTEFFCTIRDGKILYPKLVREEFGQLEDGRYLITIKKASRRTLNQNNWFHAVLPDIMEGLRNAGYQIRSVQDCKEIVKALFFKKTVSNGIEEIEVIEDTSNTSKEDFTIRAQNIIDWAKEYLGIDIAPPLKQITMFQ